MGRPRLNKATSRASYIDVVPIWEEALKRNGLQVTFDDENKAISKVFRLNAWRINRRKEGDFSLDRFMVRRKAMTLRIEERPGLEGIIETLDGEKIEILSDDEKMAPAGERKIRMDGVLANKDDYEVFQEVNAWRVGQGLRPKTFEEMFPKQELQL